MNYDSYTPVAFCELCNGEFEEGVEEDYPLCLECSCEVTHQPTMTACYLPAGHQGDHRYTAPDHEPTEDEIQEALTSIGKAVK